MPGLGGWPGRRHDRRRRAERDVDEEIRLHLEQRVEELRARGWSDEGAWRQARRRFGDVERTRAVCVESDLRWEAKMAARRRFDQALQDLTGAWHALVRHPGFSLAAVGTLALGIGIATVIFSAADHVLFRPLPFAEPDRAVTLWVQDPAEPDARIPVRPGDFLAWREHADVFESMGLAEPYAFDVVTEGRSVSVPAWLVTPGFFQTVGFSPRLGRDFLPHEAEQGAAPVVIVSDGFWKRHLGGDPAAVGSTLEFDGMPAEIVGVLPPSSHLWPAGRDLWAPKVFQDYERQSYGRGYMYAVARLARGASLDQARREMARVDGEVDRIRRPSAELGVTVLSLEDDILGDVRPALLILLGAVGMLLLVACANVAGLLLARGQRRADELAVRTALGAGRGRLFRQLFAESALLAALGGALGVLISVGGVALLARLVPPELPRATDIALDLRVLLFAMAATLGTALLCGLFPALRFSGTTGRDTAASRRSTAGPASHRARRALVTLEVAAAVVLLVGSGLLGRSYVALLSTDPGFEWRGVAAVQAFLWDRNPTAGERLQAVARVLEQIRAQPGVEAAGVATAPPFMPDRIDAAAPVVRPGTDPDAAPTVYTTIADAGYFATLRIPLIAGRNFEATDDAAGERVTLLNETAARTLFGDDDPIGRTLRFGVMAAPTEWRVVGVVGDVRPEAFDSPVQPELFVPFAQTGNGSVTFVARGPDADALLVSLRDAVWSVDAGQSIYRATTLAGVVGDLLAERRFQLVLFGLFGGLALALSAVGLFALISFTAQQRSREVGIRVALGARQAQIVGLVVREGLGLALLGATAGLASAALLSRLLAGWLHGVPPVDAPTYLALTVVVIAVAGVASFVPARRAARGDPVRALRGE